MKSDLELSSRYGMRTEEFSSLMAYRVRNILLVASRYDAFVLEEDGQLTELIFEEYRQLDLNLRYAPRFHRATTAEEAMKKLQEREIQMVLVTPRLPGSDVRSFGQAVKEQYPGVAVGVLAAHAWDLPQLEGLREAGQADLIFLWQGDVKVVLAMIKQVEDRRNADHDVLETGVQVIILVEDEVRFYSAYLPHIYTEVTTQTSRLMAEGLNLSHRLLRIRARPKILLAQTFEEAMSFFERYRPNVLGVISDISFPMAGQQQPGAGLVLAQTIRESDLDVPILLQSSDRNWKTRALACEASFLYKNSPDLLHELSRYIHENFGFGDFVFRLPNGTALARASDLREMVKVIPSVPEASIEYHALRNHFSRWLKARTEFELAALLQPKRVSEFESIRELKRFLISTLTDYVHQIKKHIITDFEATTYDRFVPFAKAGSGSLGGKGRGLAFMHKLLSERPLIGPRLEVTVPRTLVLAADVFEEFLAANHLEEIVREADTMSDEEILDAFRAGRFPHERRAHLADFLEQVDQPLAVRSSSILEDSLYQPFAGVYATVMLANRHPSLDVRLAQLLEGIKRVYASTFFSAAREYLATTPYRIEEERMAILIQELVGSEHGTLFYPTLSGVAASYNYYPFARMHPEDGVALIALGLGKSVVDGFEALRFCPGHPQILPQLSSPQDALKNAQRRFYALDLSQADWIPQMDIDANLIHADVAEALSEPFAPYIVSTYLPENDALTQGLAQGGTPLITFGTLLRGRFLPFAKILDQVLHSVAEAIGNPVEIEFAMDLSQHSEDNFSFNVLQVRPIAGDVGEEQQITPEMVEHAIVYASEALGHGRSDLLREVVVVDPRHLDRAWTPQIAAALAEINLKIGEAGATSLFIGPGRWGSRDPWLGIPVVWSQISTARAIVETDFVDLEVEPSQGSHFFHNLTCFGVAYLTVHEGRGDNRIDWNWLEQQEEIDRAVNGVVRHIRLRHPVRVLVNGVRGKGVVLPAEPEAIE